ncbi:MAG: UbiA family prenyltransferase [Pyrinomonadaceae bacterium]
MTTLRTISQFLRLESSLLGFLALFIPLFTRNNDISLSFRTAVPLLFIAFCTFITNDLDDLEKDRVNHPDRALPAGLFSPAFAVILYFTFLGLALFSTKYFTPPNLSFLYYSAISLSISYGYVVAYLPVLKTPYVAIATTVPILIVACHYPNEIKLYAATGSIFLLTLGRETCKDIRDRAGDALTFMHRFKPVPLAKAAFSLQTLGLLPLACVINTTGDVIDLLAMVFLLAVSGVYWFKFESYKLSLILMKIQLFVGLYFLI